MVYRFRVTYEDHEDVFRDIDIRSIQSFMELHGAIQQAIAFDNTKPAHFYLSDDYWRRTDEIAAVNVKEEPKKGKKGSKGEEEAPKKRTIADHVESPHQKFVYVFDPEKEWTFTVELIKIIPEDGKTQYPACVKTSGVSPKQYKETILPPPPEDDDEPKAKKEDGDDFPEGMVEKKTEEEEEDAIILPADDELPSDEPEAETGGEEDEKGESSEDFEFDDEEDPL